MLKQTNRTVPWYKHAWVSLRHKYMYRLPDQHETVMPVIVIRDAYFWMNSMCESPYTMAWNHSNSHCPNLVEEDALMDYASNHNNNNKDNEEEGEQQQQSTIPAHLGVPVWIRWARWAREWPSLAHVWTSWYQEYLHADFPRLIIRFEDLLFHTEAVLEEIKECVGAEWVHDTFVYQTKPAKTHPYFGECVQSIVLLFLFCFRVVMILILIFLSHSRYFLLNTQTIKQTNRIV